MNNHIQAQFSICSLLAQKERNTSINVLTDQPAFYKNLSNKVNIIKVEDHILTEWRGEYDYLWRIKIKAIEMICKLYKNEAVIYLDSDTFLYHDFQPLREKLNTGIALMHENEGPLSKAKSKTEKKMWSRVINYNFGKIQVLGSQCMWNAGVVATPNTKNGMEMADALQICDDICRLGVKNNIIEQFSVSLALNENYGLEAAKPSIAHYWSNKEAWNIVISELFMEAHFKALTIDELVQQVKGFNYSALPIKMRTRNTKLRLEKLVRKIFPHRDLFFIDTNYKQADAEK